MKKMTAYSAKIFKTLQQLWNKKKLCHSVYANPQGIKKKKGKEKKSLIPDNDPNLLPGSLNKVSSYHQNSGLLCLNFMLL